MLFNIIKKIIGVCLFGIGIGVLMVLLLPSVAWLFIIGVAMSIVGLICISK